MSRFRTAAALTVAATALLVLAGAGAASAVPIGQPDGQADSPAAEIAIVGTQDAGTVTGTYGTPTVPPVAYPAGEATGTDAYAALIQVQDVDSGLESLAYCTDLRTDTYIGTQYSSADWSSGEVANASYVSWILTHNYPYVPNVPAAASDTDRVSAIQSAIWYFSDGFVLTSTDPHRALTEAIVADALANGGSVTPPTPPSLGIDPSSAQGPSDGAVGPFTVTGDAVAAAVEQEEDLQLFLDAQGTVPAPVGTPVSPGTQLWARGVDPAEPGTVVVGEDYQVPVGTLYLADPGPNDYQKIVLAQTDVLPVRAQATASVYAAAGLQVTKAISGPAAGSQGPITLVVTCDPAPAASVVTSWTLPAQTAAGSYSYVFTGLPVGATCTVSETANGASSTVALTSSSITPATTVITATPTATVAVSDTYSSVPVPPAPPAPASSGTTSLAATGVGSPTPMVSVAVGMLLVGAAAVGTVARRRRATTRSPQR